MINPLKDVDILELADRYNFIIEKYVALAVDLAPRLDKFGKYKQELELISVEFVARGYTPSNSESLKKMVEEAIQKRKTENNVEQKPDSPG